MISKINGQGEPWNRRHRGIEVTKESVLSTSPSFRALNGNNGAVPISTSLPVSVSVVRRLLAQRRFLDRL